MCNQDDQSSGSGLGETIFWIATVAVVAFVGLGGLGIIGFTLSA